jgi:uncharacterized membrane protein YgcG
VLEKELTVSCELKDNAGSILDDGSATGDDFVSDDLLEGGLSGNSLGSDSDPSGDNMPSNVLLKDKDFQKFVQRSTVAPQLAHMELNSNRRNDHKKTEKLAKSKRKKERERAKGSKGGRKKSLRDAAGDVMSKMASVKMVERGVSEELLNPNKIFQTHKMKPAPKVQERQPLLMTTVQMTRRIQAPSATVVAAPPPGGGSPKQTHAQERRQSAALAAQRLMHASASEGNLRRASTGGGGNIHAQVGSGGGGVLPANFGGGGGRRGGGGAEREQHGQHGREQRLCLRSAPQVCAQGGVADAHPRGPVDSPLLTLDSRARAGTRRRRTHRRCRRRPGGASRPFWGASRGPAIPGRGLPRAGRGMGGY